MRNILYGRSGRRISQSFSSSEDDSDCLVREQSYMIPSDAGACPKLSAQQGSSLYATTGTRSDHRDRRRFSLLDLPDDVLLLIIEQVMETDFVHSFRQWAVLLLVCKCMYQVGKRFPLELEISEDQAKWLEAAEVTLRRLLVYAPMSNLLGSLPGLCRFAGTLQELRGLCVVRKPNAVLNRHDRTRRKDVACCDLSGFSALRSLSLSTDHRMDLRLPSTLTSLTMIQAGDFSEFLSLDANIPAHTPRFNASRMPELFVHWPELLRGATGLRTHLLNTTFVDLDEGVPRCKKRRPVRETPAQYRRDLEDFQQTWPQGLHLRELCAREVYIPFELAVRDAELLLFHRYTTFVTAARSAEGVLDALLGGRARKLCVETDLVCPTWTGPALCGKGKELRVRDLVAAAQSSRFASRIKVEEFCHWRCERTFLTSSTFVFTVTARWPEGDVAGCGGPLPDSWSRACQGNFSWPAE